MLTLPFLLIALAAQLGQIQLPQPVGYVNDFARVIPAASAARIEAISQDVRTKSGGEIVVVTLTDLRGRASVDVAREIGRQWKVGAQGGAGDRARNTGVVILVVPKETSPDGRGYTFIAPGTGAEGFITDGMAGQIQDEAIPLLMQRDYGGAIELMTMRVAERFAREFQFTLDSTVSLHVEVDRSQRVQTPQIPVALIIFVVFMILSMMSRRRGRGGCGGCMPIFLPFPMGGGGFGRGGGFGGGFGSGGFGGFGGFGGGGGFSGGGGGRSW